MASHGPAIHLILHDATDIDPSFDEFSRIREFISLNVSTMQQILEKRYVDNAQDPFLCDDRPWCFHPYLCVNGG